MTVDWVQTGAGLLQAGQFQKALECFEQALVGRPNDADIWLYKATALIRLQRYAEGQESYQRALAINPLLWTDEGIRLLQAGNYQGAVKCFNEALAKCPNDATTWAKKGAALLMLRRPNDAVVCFREAARLGNPEAAQALASLNQPGR
jgi:tetratricopeptide (TPR) repeat protein